MPVIRRETRHEIEPTMPPAELVPLLRRENAALRRVLREVREQRGARFPRRVEDCEHGPWRYCGAQPTHVGGIETPPLHLYTCTQCGTTRCADSFGLPNRAPTGDLGAPVTRESLEDQAGMPLGAVIVGAALLAGVWAIITAAWIIGR